MNLPTVFLTGLFAGGLSCLAVQGGLLTATLAQQTEDKLAAKSGSQLLPILSFLAAKLVAYTLLGLALGLLGSVFQLSLTTRIVLQILVVVFMVGSAFNMLEIHPIFRYFVLQPPRFLTRLIKNQSRSKSFFAPALLGAFTIFIPCGTTQAMMALAIATGSPLQAAAIMFAFVLGTSPIFFIVGYLTTKLGEALKQRFMQFAAMAILLLAVFNLQAALALAGFNPFSVGSTVASDPVSQVAINIGPGGYSPTSFTVKAGSNVTIHLNNKGGGGCAAAFTIPKLNIQKVVPVGSLSDVSFTAPSQTGDLPFMCSMGMYRGVIKVI